MLSSCIHVKLSESDCLAVVRNCVKRIGELILNDYNYHVDNLIISLLLETVVLLLSLG